VCATPDETFQAGERIGSSLRPGDVVAITGPLGAGKTILVKGIAASLSVTDPVTSPTFTLIAEYDGRLPLFHVDLYRIGSALEFDLLGLDDYFDEDGVTVIEWSDRAGSSLPERTISVTIEIDQDGNRVLSCSHDVI